MARLPTGHRIGRDHPGNTRTRRPPASRAPAGTGAGRAARALVTTRTEAHTGRLTANPQRWRACRQVTGSEGSSRQHTDTPPPGVSGPRGHRRRTGSAGAGHHPDGGAYWEADGQSAALARLPTGHRIGGIIPATHGHAAPRRLGPRGHRRRTGSAGAGHHPEAGRTPGPSHAPPPPCTGRIAAVRTCGIVGLTRCRPVGKTVAPLESGRAVTRRQRGMLPGRTPAGMPKRAPLG